MQVRVIPFGVLKDWLGTSPATVELREGASVAELLAGLGARVPTPPLRGIAVSVNAEYATAEQVLHEGDEVGLLPPVSGGTTPAAGASRTADSSVERADEPIVEPIIEPIIALTRERIDAEKLVAVAKHGEDGAVVVFDGIVRNNTRGRRTLYLNYEAYEEMALKQMRQLDAEARERFKVRQVTMVHRLGRLEVGETSVLIVVASAHRAQAFEACRWLIDTLKQTVPIWKKETFADGAVWAAGDPFPEGIAVDGAGSGQ
jgi:molybdopterin synthase catalytic subunit/molybdopterin converting factor small subunit